MKSNPSTKMSLVAATAGLLGALTVAAFAGPPPEFWAHKMTPVKSPPAPAVSKAAPATGVVCQACKTTAIRVVREVGPLGKSRTEWTTIGTQHACAHCTGTIVAKTAGGSTDAMIRDAVNCGPKLCCVPAMK